MDTGMHPHEAHHDTVRAALFLDSVKGMSV